MSKANRFIVWPEKTGNPVVDNPNRRANSQMSSGARSIRIIGSRNRKRKKFVTKAERINYLRLWAEVMLQMSRSEVESPHEH